MPAWPGGPCPNCGEDIPANIIHCRKCRTLLNTDLESDSIEIPAFRPLQELDSNVELAPRGYIISCPVCDRELRVNAKHLGQAVVCKMCSGSFEFDFRNPRIERLGYYVECPHCEERLRISRKYMGVRVECRFCNGRITVVDPIPDHPPN